MKPEGRTEGIRNELRQRSKRILGNQHRLEVAALVAVEEPPFWARRVAEQLDIAENQAAAELARLADVGLLDVLPSAYDRRKLHERRDSAFWQAAVELIETGIAAAAARTGDALEDARDAYWRALLGRSGPVRQEVE